MSILLRSGTALDFATVKYNSRVELLTAVNEELELVAGLFQLRELFQNNFLPL